MAYIQLPIHILAACLYLYITTVVYSSSILCLSNFHFCFLVFLYNGGDDDLTVQSFCISRLFTFSFLHKNGEDERPDTADGGDDQNWEDNDCHLVLRKQLLLLSFRCFLLIAAYLFLKKIFFLEFFLLLTLDFKKKSLLSFCCFLLIATFL